jgi:hypothetical protein
MKKNMEIELMESIVERERELQNTTQKTKYLATRSPLKTGSELN